MNKTELVEAVAANTGGSKADAQRSVDAVLETITTSLKQGDRVALTGFGTFEVRQRSARTGRNPQTGETINVKVVFEGGDKVHFQLKDDIFEYAGSLAERYPYEQVCVLPPDTASS